MRQSSNSGLILSLDLNGEDPMTTLPTSMPTPSNVTPFLFVSPRPSGKFDIALGLTLKALEADVAVDVCRNPNQLSRLKHASHSAWLAANTVLGECLRVPTYGNVAAGMIELFQDRAKFFSLHGPTTCNKVIAFISDELRGPRFQYRRKQFINAVVLMQVYMSQNQFEFSDIPDKIPATV